LSLPYSLYFAARFGRRVLATKNLSHLSRDRAKAAVTYRCRDAA
jgi:hypothetical protein